MWILLYHMTQRQKKMTAYHKKKTTAADENSTVRGPKPCPLLQHLTSTSDLIELPKYY
jgi:hypothetical protein